MLAGAGVCYRSAGKPCWEALVKHPRLGRRERDRQGEDPGSTSRVPRGGFSMATAATAPGVEKSHKALWLGVAIGVAITVMLPNNPNFAVGFSLRQIVSIELILFLSGLMSGLSGFGFSAVGAACLFFIR